MTVERTIRDWLKRRKTSIVFRKDMAGLGSSSQVSVALRALVDDGTLVRLAPGVFASTSRHSTLAPSDRLDALARELFRRLRVEAVLLDEKNSEAMGGVPSRAYRRLVRRIIPRQGTLSAFGASVRYRLIADASKRRSNGSTPLRERRNLFVPKARRVFAMARKAGVSYRETPVDAFANVVTRLAGDHVEPDPVRDTIQALKRAGVIDLGQLLSLTKAYMDETLNVQSL